MHVESRRRGNWLRATILSRLVFWQASHPSPWSSSQSINQSISAHLPGAFVVCRLSVVSFEGAERHLPTPDTIQTRAFLPVNQSPRPVSRPPNLIQPNTYSNRLLLCLPGFVFFFLPTSSGKLCVHVCDLLRAPLPRRPLPPRLERAETEAPRSPSQPDPRGRPA